MSELLAFRRDRDWEQFHDPRSLVLALSVEVAELVEHFLWAKDGDLAARVATHREGIEAEIADVAIYLSYLCHDLGIDIDAAVARKMAANGLRYPVETARGNANKARE